MAEPHTQTPREPLSPEVVLVAPAELAALARAALPDRPWEAFLPRRNGGAAALHAVRALQAAPPTPAPPPRRRLLAGPLRRVGGDLGRFMLACAAVVAAFVLGITLGPAGDSIPVTTVQVAARTPVPASRPPTPTAPARSPRTMPSAASRGSSPPLPTAAPAPVAQRSAVQPVAEGGYIFGPSHFRVSADRRYVTNLEVEARCAPRSPLPSIAIGPGGTFVFAGRIGTGRVSVEVTGRFVSSQRAVGSLRFHSPDCDSGLIRFSARLS